MLKISSSHSVTRATIKLVSGWTTENLIHGLNHGIEPLVAMGCIESATITETTTRTYKPEHHPCFRGQ